MNKSDVESTLDQLAQVKAASPDKAEIADHLIGWKSKSAKNS